MHLRYKEDLQGLGSSCLLQKPQRMFMSIMSHYHQLLLHSGCFSWLIFYYARIFVSYFP